MRTLSAAVSLTLLVAGCSDTAGDGTGGASSASGTGGEVGTTGSSTGTTTTSTSTSSATSGGMGGAGGGGGGASAGSGGAVPGTCTDPHELTGSATVQGTLMGATDLHNPGFGGCAGSNTNGADVVYTIDVPAGETLTARVKPIWVENLALYLLTDCGDDASCVVGEDGAGDSWELVQYKNDGTTSLTLYVVVDSKMATHDFELDVNIGPEANCADLWDNDLNGTTDCADPACQGTPACAPGSNPAGSPCTAHTDCAATGGDPLCLPKYGPVGYCSEGCSPFTNTGCSGDGVCVDQGFGIFDVGWCFDGCSVDGDCIGTQYCRMPEGYCDY